MDSLYLLRRAVGFHLAAWVETELIRVQQKVARALVRAKRVNNWKSASIASGKKVLSVIVAFS
jgi:hypothetical protein